MDDKKAHDGAEMSLEQLQSYLDASPFHKLFPMQLVDADREHQQIRIRLGFTPAVERAEGSGQYHGGVIASLIDIAGDFALVYLLNRAVPTINIRIDYLRAAVGTDLVAVATVRRVGRTVGVVDIDVVDGQMRLVAVGRGCYGTQPQ
jgi:uncharacterized protein (TIGR00369 family)